MPRINITTETTSIIIGMRVTATVLNATFRCGNLWRWVSAAESFPVPPRWSCS